jgi:hypothetical protein
VLWSKFIFQVTVILDKCVIINSCLLTGWFFSSYDLTPYALDNPVRKWGVTAII